MRLVIAVVALALSASVASAGGINLAWNDCYGGGGATNRSFTCDTNAGSNELYVSFELPVDIGGYVIGSTATIDLQAASPVLPPWWQFKNTGSCRQISLMSLQALPGNCVDMWSGAGFGGIVSYLVTAVSGGMPPDRARIFTDNSVNEVYASYLQLGTEYTTAVLRIDNARTVGSTCSGCQVPICLVLNEINLFYYDGNDSNFYLTNPLVSNFATWQGGAVGGAGCPAATPTLNRTWGQLKSVYR